MRIALVPGDGIGSEVLAGPSELARDLGQRGLSIEVTGPWPAGVTAVQEYGQLLPPHTLAACEEADAILLGAIGEHPGINGVARPELALIALRRHFGLGVSVRQIWRPTRVPLIVVRNLLGGAYVDDCARTESTEDSAAVDPFTLEPSRIRQVVEVALLVKAGSHIDDVYSVDKANLLATSRLWRRIAGEAFAAAGVNVRHVLVDHFAYEVGKDTVTSGLVVTEGLFGDILSDLAAARAGSIALCSSASINVDPTYRTVGLFEPVHGSAPRLAGKGRANPTGAYLALAAAMDLFAELSTVADKIRCGLSEVIEAGIVTYDLAGDRATAVPTAVFANEVNASILHLIDVSEEGAGRQQGGSSQ